METEVKAAKGKPAAVAEVTRGNVTIEIFPATNVVNGKSYPQFRFTYLHGGRRVRRRFADLADAKKEAGTIAAALSNQGTKISSLTGADAEAHIEAKRLVAPTGKSLLRFVEECVDAVKRLPHGATLAQAVDLFVKRNPIDISQKTVQQVVDELVAAKTAARRSAVHLKDLELRLGKFADACQMPIGHVTGTMIQEYLDRQTSFSGRTKRNHLRLITTLFKFAIRKKYLAKDAMDELEAVEKPYEELTDIEVFSRDEMVEILANARPQLIPWLTISAFAGLRAAELQRLDWSEVNLAERHIEVPAAKAKTASRRIVPITDNLLAWLAPINPKSGPVTAFENMAKQIAWLVEDINGARVARAKEAGKSLDSVPAFEWRRNGLRHSFISYRTAQIKDVAQVALEAGNSPTMVFRNYRKLVTEAEARAWFGIMPGETSGIHCPAGEETRFLAKS